jgi:hypothetical protein
MKKLLILLLLVGGLIIMEPISRLIRNTVGNIVYRGAFVTGIITADNGDKSYAVEIGESGKSRKKVFTLSPDPDLKVGDKARILYRGGNKEDPILLAPTKPAILRRYALIVASPNTLQLFDMDGILLKSISVTGWGYGQCGITMDSQGNIYTEENAEIIKKYDSNLNLLVTKNIEEDIDGINMGSDGYLYTLELIDEGYDVKKRSISDLTIVATIPITTNIYYAYSGGLCLDSNGNIYVYQNPYVEKYSNSGIKLASIDVGNLSNEYAGCGVLGNYVYFVKGTNTIIYLPLNLSSYSTWNLGMAIAYGITVADNHLICTGWDTDNDGATAKYDSNRNLVWVKKLNPTSQYGYKASGYNF